MLAVSAARRTDFSRLSFRITHSMETYPRERLPIPPEAKPKLNWFGVAAQDYIRHILFSRMQDEVLVYWPYAAREENKSLTNWCSYSEHCEVRSEHFLHLQVYTDSSSTTPEALRCYIVKLSP